MFTTQRQKKILGIKNKKKINILSKNFDNFLYIESQIAKDKGEVFNSKSFLKKNFKNSKIKILNASLKKFKAKNYGYELIFKENKNIFTKKTNIMYRCFKH